jgi:hypothetical protein
MRKWIAGVAVVAMLMGAGACGSGTEEVWEDQGGEADAICVTKDTHERVSDSQCDSGGSNNNWIFWYLLAGQMAPRYGYPAQYGQPNVPSTYHVYHHRVPTTGGVVKAKAPVRTKVTRQKTTTQKKNTWPQYNPANKSKTQDPAKPAAPKKKWWNTGKNGNTGGGYKPPAGGGYKPPASKPYSPPRTTTRYR